MHADRVCPYVQVARPARVIDLFFKHWGWNMMELWMQIDPNAVHSVTEFLERWICFQVSTACIADSLAIGTHPESIALVALIGIDEIFWPWGGWLRLCSESLLARFWDGTVSTSTERKALWCRNCLLKDFRARRPTCRQGPWMPVKELREHRELKPMWQSHQGCLRLLWKSTPQILKLLLIWLTFVISCQLSSFLISNCKCLALSDSRAEDPTPNRTDLYIRSAIWAKNGACPRLEPMHVPVDFQCADPSAENDLKSDFSWTCVFCIIYDYK